MHVESITMLRHTITSTVYCDIKPIVTDIIRKYSYKMCLAFYKNTAVEFNQNNITVFDCIGPRLWGQVWSSTIV